MSLDLCDQLSTHFSAVETLFIVGGSDPSSSSNDDVEAVSLSQSPVECPQVADFPYPIAYIKAATLQGAPVVCGGYSSLG